MSLGKSLLKRLFRISLHHSVNAASDFLNFPGAVRRLIVSFPFKDTPQRNSNPKNSNFVFSSLRNREKLMMLVFSSIKNGERYRKLEMETGISLKTGILQYGRITAGSLGIIQTMLKA